MYQCVYVHVSVCMLYQCTYLFCPLCLKKKQIVFVRLGLHILLVPGAFALGVGGGPCATTTGGISKLHLFIYVV